MQDHPSMQNGTRKYWQVNTECYFVTLDRPQDSTPTEANHPGNQETTDQTEHQTHQMMHTLLHHGQQILV